MKRLVYALALTSLAACGKVDSVADAAATQDGTIVTIDAAPNSIDALHLLIDAMVGPMSIDANLPGTPDAAGHPPIDAMGMPTVDAQVFHVVVGFASSAPTTVSSQTTTPLPVAFSGGQPNTSVSWSASATLGFFDQSTGSVTLDSHGAATMNLNYNAPAVSANNTPATITISIPADGASAVHHVEILCTTAVTGGPRSPLAQLPACPV